jgi:hypothetical protein
MTYFAEHGGGFSHDAVNRMLRRDKLTPRLVWEHVKTDVVTSPRGCLIFDDTIIDKNHSHHIDLVRLQYSGNAHGLIKGIGMVNCLYINPDNGQYWIVDYRLYDPERDGKSKLDHVREMLTRALSEKALPAKTVLMDTWYATKDMMVFLDALKLTFICPIKANRLVDDSGGQQPYRLPEDLDWKAHDILQGKTVKIHKFPNGFKVKLFRVASTHRTDWIVTNDLHHDSSQVVQDACALRWKIEQFHRELKQVTGVEKCQARTARIQRNHIACAVLVWVRLTKLAREATTTIYQLKRGQLSKYLRNELRSPALSMRAA